MSPRTTSDAGGWAGVAYLSTVPCRTMATPWPPDLYESGRIQFASFCTSLSWVSGSVVYGFPEGKTHSRAFELTERMLDFAFDHMQSIPGPRFMCGDWNFTLDSLTVSSRLQDSGWVEVQDLQHMRTGAPIRPTCKQVSRKDFLWLSPELALAFRGLRFCDETFADHSLLLADFVGGAKQIERFPWPCPKPIDWKGVPPLSSPVSFAAPADPTSQYADLWRQREEQAKAALAPDWIPSMQGRGQQTKPSKITGHQAPLRQGKSSEVQPSFFGFSALHAKQFRQLRRLQNYCRWVDNKQRLGSNDPLHGFGLWTSILKAPGFLPSFAGWWHHRQFSSPLDPVDMPQFCPPSHVAHQIFDAVLAEVRLFESRLNAARSAHRKSQHEQDRALIFREVARPVAAPVDSLVHSLAATVDAVDDQECAVILDKPVDILPSHPVWIAGQAKQVIHAEHDKIWVDDVESCQPGSVMVQRQLVGDLQEIFDAFHEQWKARWCRHDQIPFTHWNELIGFARSVLRPCAVPHLSIGSDLFLSECQRKKKRSATGLDGVSRMDLLHGDPCTTQSLTSVFQRAESDGCWPQQLLAGKVHSLAKVEGASGVGDFRPITVFGLPYRIWSSVQSRYLLKHAEAWADDGVFGNRQGRQAADLWHHLMLQIEQAYAAGHVLCGVSADIEKCFNCIPRYPALCLAVLVGVPHQVTTAWAGALAGMCRHFKVRDSYSAGFHTSTGLAEGCGLSVFGMLLVDHVFSCWMRVQLPEIRVLSYVDDWQTYSWNPDHAVRQLNALERFATMLDLAVDRKKTFGWSTDGEVRQTMRAAGLQVLHQARELGGHLGISKRWSNRTLVQRFGALEDFWPKLAASKAKYAAKVWMLRSVAWPRGLHAVSSAPIGDHHWVDLRRKATKAIGYQRPGVNSYLLLGLLEPDADPQLVALLWTCRAVRQQCHEDFWSSCVAPYAAGELDLPPNALAVIVQSRLAQVGLSVRPDGLVSDQFGCFNVHTTNFSEVEYRLHWAWSGFVASKVQHRHEFHGLWQVDVATTRRALAKLSRDDQALCRLSLAGSLFTESYKSKWADQTADCPWCGQPDHLCHRYWECPQHADLRASLAPDVLPLLDSIPPALALRGWALLPPTWAGWIRTLLRLPSDIPLPTCGLLPGTWNHVFTDGSCLHSAEPRYRLAAWSAVIAPDCDRLWSPGRASVLCASFLPGLCQTAYRSELFAVAYVLHWAAVFQAPVVIWTDCRSVMLRFCNYFWGNRRISVNRPHSDLWQWIAHSVAALGGERIKLRKVPAHRDPTQARTLVEAWQSFHNDMTDRAARLANQARPQCFWQQWEEHVQATHAADRLFQQVHALQLEVGRRHVKCESIPAAPAAPPKETRVFTMSFDVGQWVGQIPPKVARLFGYSHTHRAARWLQARLVQADATSMVWVSFVQLYIDFQLSFGNPGPLSVNQQWVDVEQRPYLEAERFAFRQRIRWFRRFLKNFWQEAGLRIGLEQTKPHSQVVQAFLPAASVPWDAKALQTVDVWLMRQLSGPCVRGAEVLSSLPLAGLDANMAVNLH